MTAEILSAIKIGQAMFLEEYEYLSEQDSERTKENQIEINQ